MNEPAEALLRRGDIMGAYTFNYCPYSVHRSKWHPVCVSPIQKTGWRSSHLPRGGSHGQARGQGVVPEAQQAFSG